MIEDYLNLLDNLVLLSNVVDEKIEHDSLTGLSDDDHTQYHNNTRGDARYYQKSEVDEGIDSDISTHTALNNAHHAESHNVASHNDTTATGSELNELTGGGNTTLHSHETTGWSGTFLNGDGDTVTVSNGLITDVS